MIGLSIEPTTLRIPRPTPVRSSRECNQSPFLTCTGHAARGAERLRNQEGGDLPFGLALSPPSKAPHIRTWRPRLRSGAYKCVFFNAERRCTSTIRAGLSSAWSRVLGQRLYFATADRPRGSPERDRLSLWAEASAVPAAACRGCLVLRRRPLLFPLSNSVPQRHDPSTEPAVAVLAAASCAAPALAPPLR